MTAQDALVEVLARVAAQNGGTVFIGADELARWPATAVTAMKSAGWLRATSPARSVVCPGCERHCTMPVNVLQATPTSPGRAFIVCDKRDDVNRVSIPLHALTQWQTSGEDVANFLLRQLEIPGALTRMEAQGSWRIGVFRGGRQAAHLVLECVAPLRLCLAGHALTLEELLLFSAGKIAVDRRRLVIAADNPAEGGGTQETASQRRERVQRRIKELQAQGVRNFNQVVASEEGVHVSRIQQILQKNPSKKSKAPASWTSGLAK